ncbi:MAG: hypothetical protein H0W06_09195 [Chloroflexia bacterium]|nr:hypothetical protein [Chloroflexia bacterium]
MTRAVGRPAKRIRLSIEIDLDLHHQLIQAATLDDITVILYVEQAIQARLQRDMIDSNSEPATLTAGMDPVLAELWDNDEDAVYDRL